MFSIGRILYGTYNLHFPQILTALFWKIYTKAEYDSVYNTQVWVLTVSEEEEEEDSCTYYPMLHSSNSNTADRPDGRISVQFGQ